MYHGGSIVRLEREDKRMNAFSFREPILQTSIVTAESLPKAQSLPAYDIRHWTLLRSTWSGQSPRINV